MTLQQALKKGRFFKRPKHRDYLYVNSVGIICWMNHMPHHASFTHEAILADDWLVFDTVPEIVKKEDTKILKFPNRRRK